MKGKQIILNILVTNTKKKNTPFELKYNQGSYPIHEYILQCFHEKKKTSVILFRNEPLDEKKKYEDLKCDKLESFQLYIFPEPKYKQAFLDMIQKGKNIDTYYYALIKAEGDEDKAFDIAQPKKEGIFLNLDTFVESAEDYEAINCAYSQFDSNSTTPLSPWQYLKHFSLREDLYQNEKVKNFLDSFDKEFKYKRKVYEYYKFRLTKQELNDVNTLLHEYYNITLETNDGDEEDAENEIIAKKQLVLNTYMHSDKKIDMSRNVLDCIV